MISPKFRSFFVFFIAFWLLSSPAGASLAPQSGRSISAYDFPVIPGLESKVSFWKKIYTQYTTRQAIVHDMDDLNVIYEVVDLDPKKSRRQNERKLKRIRAKYKTILRKLGRSKNHSTLNPEEKRVARLVKGRYYAASRNIRTQTGQKDRFRAGLVRSGKYMDKIRRIFREHGLPVELTALPHVESSFQLKAYSSAGAAGIWQFTRGTGRLFMSVGYEVDERRDPILSTQGAAKLLKHNYEQLGSWPLAVTAYNHGTEGMRRAKRRYGPNLPRIIQRYRSRTFGFASKNFYAEFLAALDISRNHKKYFPGLRFERPLPVVSVKFRDYIHIDTVSRYFKMTRDEIAHYNPALRLPVLSGSRRIPAGFIFKAPSRKLKDLSSRYGVIPAKHKHTRQIRSKWYTVRRGDTLSSIAARFRTTVGKLKGINNIYRGSIIYRGQVLRIPTRKGKTPRVSPVRRAQAKPQPKLKPGFVTRTETVSYKVRRNDNLSRIAKRFNSTPEVLALVNLIKDPDTLHPGQLLKIPKSVVVAQAIKTSAQPKNAGRPAKPKNFFLKVDKKAVVKKAPLRRDDSGVTITFASNSIQEGKINKHRPAFRPVSFVSGSPEKFPVGIIKVDFDETLSHYAEWSGLSVRELRRWNGMSRKRKIHVNQEIEVPFSRRSPNHFEEKRQEYHRAIQEDFFSSFRVDKIVTKNVRRGETLWEICNDKYFIPFWLLSNFNSEKNVNSLHEGDTIKIPFITPIKNKDA